MFNLVLHHFLDPGERVEADEGYAGHTDKVKCPVNPANSPEILEMQGRVRAHHEKLNGHLKNWAILDNVYCHDILRHGNVFRASALLLLMQLTIDDGEPLFDIEYGD